MRRLTLALALVALLHPLPAAAQLGPTRPQQPQQREPPDPADTIPVPQFREAPPVSPAVSALLSLLVPGWGQSIARRRNTGAVFIFWEGVTAFMTLKSMHQRHYLESIGADEEVLQSKRAEIQDWAVLLGFNHLMAAAEAYVATQLWDFPATLGGQALPDGSLGVGLRVRW